MRNYESPSDPDPKILDPTDSITYPHPPALHSHPIVHFQYFYFLKVFLDILYLRPKFGLPFLRLQCRKSSLSLNYRFFALLQNSLKWCERVTSNFILPFISENNPLISIRSYYIDLLLIIDLPIEYNDQLHLEMILKYISWSTFFFSLYQINIKKSRESTLTYQNLFQ